MINLAPLEYASSNASFSLCICSLLLLLLFPVLSTIVLIKCIKSTALVGIVVSLETILLIVFKLVYLFQVAKPMLLCDIQLFINNSLAYFVSRIIYVARNQ